MGFGSGVFVNDLLFLAAFFSFPLSHENRGGRDPEHKQKQHHHADDN